MLISLEGQTIGAKIDHCRVGGVETGISSRGIQQEGTQVISCEMVGVRDGYNFRTSSFGGPGVWLLNCHVNATRKGFDFGNRLDVSAVGCTSYRSSVVFDEDWLGLDFELTQGARVATSAVINSIVSGTSQCDAFRLLNSTGISGVANEVKNTRKGFVLQGGCSGISFSESSMFATSGYSETILETASTDSDVVFGRHAVISTWSAPYSIATYKDSIVIDYGRVNYNRTAAVSESAANTYTLTPGDSPQFWRVALAAGSGAYDVNVEFNLVGAKDGDYFDFYLNLPSVSDRRVVFKNGVGGGVIATVATASSARYGARFYYSRALGAWQGAWINQSVFV
jgi:hypothetical protein